MTETNTTEAKTDNPLATPERAAELALAELAPMRETVASIVEENKGLSFDLEDKSELADAKRFLTRARGVKADVEERRVAIKAPALHFGREVDRIAKEIVAPVIEIIDQHAPGIKAIAQREKLRQAEIDKAIEALKGMSIEHPHGETSGDIQARIDGLEAHEPTEEVYGKRYDEAVNIRECEIRRLKLALEDVQRSEADAAELAELRKKQADREKAEREEAQRIEREEIDRKAREDEQERARKEAAELEAENTRLRDEAVQRAIDDLSTSFAPPFGAGADQIEDILIKARDVDTDVELYGDRRGDAAEAIKLTIARLERLYMQAQEAERDRAELNRVIEIEAMGAIPPEMGIDDVEARLASAEAIHVEDGQEDGRISVAKQKAVEAIKMAIVRAKTRKEQRAQRRAKSVVVIESIIIGAESEKQAAENILNALYAGEIPGVTVG